MTNGALSSRAVWTRLAAGCLIPGMVLACDVDTRRDRERAARAAAAHEAAAADAPYQAEVEEGLGAAVAIIVDTSGSMKDARRRRRAAEDRGRAQAIEPMLDATDAFIARRPDFPIKIGIYSFSSGVRELRADSALRSRRDRAALAEPAAAGRWHRDRRSDARGAAGALSRRRVPEVPAGRDRRREHPRPRARTRSRARSSARAKARCRSISSRSTPAPRSSPSSKRSAATSSAPAPGRAAHGARRHLPGQDPRRGDGCRRAGTGRK